MKKYLSFSTPISRKCFIKNLALIAIITTILGYCTQPILLRSHDYSAYYEMHTYIQQLNQQERKDVEKELGISKFGLTENIETS